MKRNNGYKFRAYEIESEEYQHEEGQAQIPVAAPKQAASGKHPQKGSGWKVETFLAPRKAHGVSKPKSPKVPKASKPPKMPKAKTKKKRPPQKRWFARKEKPPEVSPLESGATAVPDILAPASADFTSRDFVVVDGVYHSYLYIAGYGYASAVASGWLSPLVEIGEGVNLSFTARRQQKDKILPKIAQSTMVNRSRMRDVGDTRQDYEELDSAIASGLWMKEEMNRGGEDFYYMSTVIEVTAGDPDTLEHRVGAVETRCTSLGMVAKRCDYRHGQAFLSCLPLLSPDPDIERKSRRNALTTGVAAAFPFSSFEICDQNGIMLGISTCTTARSAWWIPLTASSIPTDIFACSA